MSARRALPVIDRHHNPPILGRAPPPPPPPPPPPHPHDSLLRHPHPHHLLPPPSSRPAPPPAVAVLQDRLAALDRQIQALLLDNQRLAAVHVALRQELIQAQQDLRLAAASASRAREAKDAELRDVLERARHAEAAARRVEAVRAEIARVGDDVRRLSMSRDEMVQRLVGMRGELGRMRAENGTMEMVAKEIEAMKHELQKGRAAIEFEKKAHAENDAQSKQMENSMVSMAREIEKLRAELANIEKRAQPANAPNPGYAGSYGNPLEAGTYGSYADPYKQPHVQRTPDGTAQYVPTSGSQPIPAYNAQQTNPQR